MLRKIVDRFFIKKPKFRRLVTRILYGNDNCQINIFGQLFTINRLRENGYLRASKRIRGSSLLEDEAGVILTLTLGCGSVNTFIDAGANIGLFSCFAVRRKIFDPDFRVIAFEPHPDTFSRLQLNAQDSGVEAHNVALSNQDGELKFVDGAVSHVFTAQDHANRYNIPREIIVVRAQKLDNMQLSDRSIMLKIDVEGQEYAVLQGAERLFASRAIKIVYIDGFTNINVVSFLSEREFDLFDLRTMKKTPNPEFSLLGIYRGQ